MESFLNSVNFRKTLIFSTLFLFYNSCNNEMNCSKVYQSIKRNNCNIVVTENKNNTYYLKIKGIDIPSQEFITFTESRMWRPLSEYINVGDTVLKNEGEPIMYVFKKDFIVEMNHVGLCNENFDWDNSVKIIMRNKE